MQCKTPGGAGDSKDVDIAKESGKSRALKWAMKDEIVSRLFDNDLNSPPLFPRWEKNITQDASEWPKQHHQPNEQTGIYRTLHQTWQNMYYLPVHIKHPLMHNVKV